jgi:hypothetical protein
MTDTSYNFVIFNPILESIIEETDIIEECDIVFDDIDIDSDYNVGYGIDIENDGITEIFISPINVISVYNKRVICCKLICISVACVVIFIYITFLLRTR